MIMTESNMKQQEFNHQSSKLVDIVPTQQRGDNNANIVGVVEGDFKSEQQPTVTTKRKTRRSRRGGYRRKRQQRKKIAALLAANTTTSSKCSTTTATYCDNSTVTTETESDSVSCDSSIASSNEYNNNNHSYDTSKNIQQRSWADGRKLSRTNQNYNRNRNSSNYEAGDDNSIMNFQMHVHVPAWEPSPHQSSSNNVEHVNGISEESSTSAESHDNYNSKLTTSRSSISITTPPPAAASVTAGLEEASLTKEQQKQYVALDCEMVGVGPDGRYSALARVTVIDWNGKILMDEFIKPGQEVTDYRTFVSGITPSILKTKAKMDYFTCRKKVMALLKGKILVGHALNNDLEVLRINHPWFMIRDTAMYEPFMKIRFQDGVLWPRSLRDLAKEILHQDVQVYGQPHCSYEDALAALDLYRLVWKTWELSMEYKINRAWHIQQQQEQYRVQRKYQNKLHKQIKQQKDGR